MTTQIHRLRDSGTVYLPVEEARAIARAMLKCVLDIGERSFEERAFHTYTYPPVEETQV